MVGSNNRLICLTRVDFPLPERPITQNISPGLILKDTSDTPITELYSSKATCFEICCLVMASNASFEVLPNILEIFLISIKLPEFS